MNDDKQILLEIEQNERWLAQRLPVEASSHEALKFRLQVDCQEQWLSDRDLQVAEEPVSASLRLAVRQAVHEAARRRAAQANQKLARKWNWLAGPAVGLAAMIILLIGVLRPVSESQPMADIVEAETNLFAYDAEEEAFDIQLEDALAELEDLVDARDESDWDDVLEDL